MTRAGFAPFAIDKNIPPPESDPAIKPRMAILHVDAGNASSLYGNFKDRTDGIEAHFFIKKDGTIEQYRSIYFQADANYLANGFAVSIETQGYGEGEWTPEQMASIRKLLLWLRDEAGIPLRVPPEWDSSGVGYHIQFGSPGKWTNVVKACPGRDRIKQYNNVLVPWFATTGGKTYEEDEVSFNDEFPVWAPSITETEKASWAGPDKKMSFGQMLQQAWGFSLRAKQRSDSTAAAVSKLSTQLASVAKAVEALSKSQDATIQAAVKEALKDGVVTVDVKVSDGDV